MACSCAIVDSPRFRVNLTNSSCFGEIWDIGQWTLWTSSTNCWVLQPLCIARGKDIYAEKYFLYSKEDSKQGEKDYFRKKLQYGTVARLRQCICELILRSHPFQIGNFSRRYSITNHRKLNEKSLLRHSLVQEDVVE